MKYKIAMVAACPFPANYGSPASIREMSISLAESGHEVHILTYPYGQDLAVAPAKLHRVGGNQTASISVGPNWQKPIINLKMIFALIRLIRREQIDIIHAHNYEGALIGICGKWLTGRPLLYNAVNTMSDELAGYDFIKPRFLANWLAAALDWFVPKPPDFITAVSEELRDDLVRKGKPEAKVDCVPAGVHPELFDGADPQRFRTKLGLENAHVVMYTGTLDAFQRLDNLYAAFAKVVEAETNAKLLMVVPIPDDAGIARERARIRELGIPDSSVLWEGPHPLDDLKDYLAMADVAVVPRPDCPGHPVKLLNYMTSACPIVCFEGSAKGIENELSGLVVPDNDTSAFAEAIFRLLRDKGLAKRIGSGARETLLREYTWTSICRKYENAYKRIHPK